MFSKKKKHTHFFEIQEFFKIFFCFREHFKKDFLRNFKKFLLGKKN